MSEVKTILAGVTVVVTALKIITQYRAQIKKEKKRYEKRN